MASPMASLQGGQWRRLVMRVILAWLSVNVGHACYLTGPGMAGARVSEVRSPVQHNLRGGGLASLVTFVMPLAKHIGSERASVACYSSKPGKANVQFTRKVKLDNVVRVRRNQMQDGTDRRMPQAKAKTPENLIKSQYTGKYDDMDLVEEENAVGDIDMIELSEDDYEIISHAESAAILKGKELLTGSIISSSALKNADMGLDDLDRLTVVQLKEICRSQKLKLTGRKQELIDRIRGHSRVASAR
mmetsp:Transcript_7570/g.17202  ORF Transcript_7570/g.17202 Transcript_7570/m.17202 type:complete len:245 (-) Transcript_7570:1079-1813(-)